LNNNINGKLINKANIVLYISKLYAYFSNSFLFATKKSALIKRKPESIFAIAKYNENSPKSPGE
ncbi:hypothetical protein, partial [Vibrio parahaemolyticus]|uniref:hypothetical protein n=1 Tax=Vibrio parahaemolyticus TaxID=670 RepID=UPI001C608C24